MDVIDVDNAGEIEAALDGIEDWVAVVYRLGNPSALAWSKHEKNTLKLANTIKATDRKKPRTASIMTNQGRLLHGNAKSLKLDHSQYPIKTSTAYAFTH